MMPAEPRCFGAQRDSGPALITPFSARLHSVHNARCTVYTVCTMCTVGTPPRLSPTPRPAMDLIAKLCTANLKPVHF